MQSQICNFQELNIYMLKKNLLKKMDFDFDDDLFDSKKEKKITDIDQIIKSYKPKIVKHEVKYSNLSKFVLINLFIFLIKIRVF